VTRQLIALAEATPADKFAWRPAPGVRSTSEVYMHIAAANFYLLSVTGPKMPAGIKPDENGENHHRESRRDRLAKTFRSMPSKQPALC